MGKNQIRRAGKKNKLTQTDKHCIFHCFVMETRLIKRSTFSRGAKKPSSLLAI